MLPPAPSKMFSCRYPHIIALLSVFMILAFRSTSNQFHICYTSTTNYTAGSDYEANLNQLLTILATGTPATGFNKTVFGSYPYLVYGLALCRVDISTADCTTCVGSVAANSLSLCPGSKEVRIWYDNCYMHYSDMAFFGAIDNTGWYSRSPNNVSDPDVFDTYRHSLTANLSSAAVADPSRLLFAMGYTQYAASKYVYGMVQCTRDVSASDCYSCLARLVERLASVCGSVEYGRLIHGTCGVRYDIAPFFDPSPPPPPASPSPPASRPPPTTADPNDPPAQHHDGGKNKRRTVILATTIPIASLVIAYGCVCTAFLVHRRRKASAPSDGNLRATEIQVLSLDAIRVATGNFSEKNRLGKGGYGPVYKGTLNGEDVAVKRLALLESGQGGAEFMNEVKTLAKLRHRNLVRLLGCCAEGNEKILVYEYMPNASLDKLLFDPAGREKLPWQIRLKIIVGIARGLVYLHEDSPLRFIIHRDLKASNVLLDEEMNAKIADFGLARDFDGDQTRINTSKIGGTLGYMAPEYLMKGEFSIRSDVYSFGVLLLEIVSGQRNGPRAANLLEIAWRNWEEERVLELMDPSLTNISCQKTQHEFMRCIHIGLLCVQDEARDRPTMCDVVAMLTNQLVPLASPVPSTIFKGRGWVDCKGNEESRTDRNYSDRLQADLGAR